MSYREENGQVILTMSREDYDRLLMVLGEATAYIIHAGSRSFFGVEVVIGLLNRMNEGNPNYRPYQIK